MIGETGDRLNLPQFNGHPERAYHGPGRVFDEQKEVNETFQEIRAGSNPTGLRVRQAGDTGRPGIRAAGEPDLQVEEAAGAG